MNTGNDLVKLGNDHMGETYRLGAFAPKDNPNWKGPWDCAEFVSWLAFQSTGMLVGCINKGLVPDGEAGPVTLAELGLPG